jgi:hypothetical protein
MSLLKPKKNMVGYKYLFVHIELFSNKVHLGYDQKLAFSSLGFVAIYIAGKCHCFNSKGRGHAYRLCMVIIPLLWATLIAASISSTNKKLTATI